MRLVEEEHEFGLRDVADLRQLLEKLGEEPHQHGREKLRLVLHRRQLEAGDDPAGVRRRPQQVGDLELRLAEELRAAAVLELDERPEQHADRRRRDAADALEVLFALLRVEEGEERSQVGEIEDRQALFVCVAEDEREALLLGLVRFERLREQERTEVGYRRANRNAGPDSAER